MKTTRDKIIDALGAAEDSGWGTVGKYSKQLISVAANELLMMGGRTVIGGIIIDQAVEIDSLRAQLAEAQKQLADEREIKSAEKQILLQEIEKNQSLKQQLLTLEAERERLREALDGIYQADKHFDGHYSAIAKEALQSSAHSPTLATVKKMAEALSATIQGKTLRKYMLEQFPATDGHIPFMQFCGKQEEALAAAKKEGLI